jgi:hypothetical protein
MWCRWIINQDIAARAAIAQANELGLATGSGPLDLDPNNPNRPPEYSLGSYVEDRLNEIGMSRRAGVTLTGHAFLPNSPSGWARILFDWAERYNEGVNKA